MAPTWIRKTLELKGIPFEELHHPGSYTAQGVAQREHMSGHGVAKVVVVMADGRPVELILPASRHVNLDRVRTVIHAHDIRLATEEEMEKSFTDCEVVAMPALDIRLFTQRACSDSLTVPTAWRSGHFGTLATGQKTGPCV